MSENFQIGNVVELKSGSPKMTIKSLDTFDNPKFTEATCEWFNKNEEYNLKGFDIKNIHIVQSQSNKN